MLSWKLHAYKCYINVAGICGYTCAIWQLHIQWFHLIHLTCSSLNPRTLHSSPWWRNNRGKAWPKINLGFYYDVLKLYKILSARSRSPEQWVPLLKYFLGDNLKFFHLFIYWFLIEGELQYYVGYCSTSTLISHRYTSVSSLMSLLPLPTWSYPSRLSQSTSLNSLSQTPDSHWLSVLRILVYVFPGYSFRLSHPLLLTPTSLVSISLSSMSTSPLLPCKKVHLYGWILPLILL